MGGPSVGYAGISVVVAAGAGIIQCVGDDGFRIVFTASLCIERGTHRCDVGVDVEGG
jgi:hypothetical protein